MQLAGSHPPTHLIRYQLLRRLERLTFKGHLLQTLRAAQSQGSKARHTVNGGLESLPRNLQSR